MSKDRTRIRVTLYIRKDLLEFVKTQSFNKYAESESRAIENAIQELKDSIFRLVR